MNNLTFNNIIFCYGSNMSSLELMKYNNKLKNNKIKQYELLDFGILNNYKFAYKNICLTAKYPKIKTAKATIIPDKKSCVYGTIVKMTDEMFELIIKKEGVYNNYYKKQQFKIKSLICDNVYDATVFIMNPSISSSNCKLNISTLPSKNYENKIVKASIFYNFPLNYIKKYLMVDRNK